MFNNQSVRTAMLALALGICLWLGVGQNLTMAAPLAVTESTFQDKVQTLPEAPLELKSEVDHYLTSIPSGYYTIANVKELKSLMADRQALLVDVREPSEYRSGHIPSAINIPLRTLAQNLSKIPGDRPVILYCSTGYRSSMGVMTLHLLNYDNVQSFPSSLSGWQKAGEAIVFR